jgi:FkbM family methyltransferase
MSTLESKTDDVHRQLATKTVHDVDFLLFAAIDRHVRRLHSILDVGANVGQSIASIRAILGPGASIHSFEANESLWPCLHSIARKAGGAVLVSEFGLGISAEEIALYLPVVDGEEIVEEASVDPSQFDKPWVVEKMLARGGMQEMRTKVVRLVNGDSLALKPDFIKVDVEGHEYSVLQGLEGTLRAKHPILLVENSDWHRVTPFVASLGYAPYRNDAGLLMPFYGETTNTFYVHADEAAHIESMNLDTRGAAPGGL